MTPGERRVALVPDVAARLARSGFEISVERGAGEAASFRDDGYAESGATLVDDAFDADGIVKVRKPTDAEVARLREGQLLIGLLEPLVDTERIERLSARGVVAFAMESIPRITRAQPMDALSSQSTVAGYKAVLLAAERLPKFFPMLMTAAAGISRGAGRPGTSAVVTTTSKSATRAASSFCWRSCSSGVSSRA